MGRRSGPRRIGEMLGGAVAPIAPQTTLAAVQRSWLAAVGGAIAAQAEPVAERDGTLEVACTNSTWAEEIDLLQGGIVARINQALGREAITGLRVKADRARFDGQGSR